jgi:hypothetical protein
VALGRLRRAALCGVLALAGCATLSPPVVDTAVLLSSPDLLKKVAVVPFVPDSAFHVSPPPAGVSAADAADLVTRFVAEAFAERRIAVVAPNDLIVAFEAEGKVLPREDVAAVAALAARQFGATAIVLGRVMRYREREGGARGALRPASVAFTLTLYEASSGKRAYQARFDETQVALSENLFLAMKYPGGGSRWLTAAELTRWGALEAIDAIPDSLR